jgi:penicillin amidase
MPSIWYEIGLHCRPKTPECGLDVAGFSFAGAPGVIIGHNDRIAWGFTNVGPDVQDLYIEKINPENPNQYEVNGQWADMTLVEETLNVAGAEAEPLTVRYTRHGPIITKTYGDLDTLNETSALDLPAQYAIALRWTALEPGNIFQSILLMNRAQDWEQFRDAASYFVAPSQNLVYADVNGNIGYQMPGKIPRRANGDGKLPVPGWTDEYEWTDYIPFAELPYSLNPESGYIVAANNDVAGPNYPYLITTSFDLGYRAQRIVDMIEAAPGAIDQAYIQTMHGDNMDLSAEFTLPVLKRIEFDDERTRQGRDLLLGWDLQMHMDTAPAALYAAFWRHLLADTFHDELPEDYWPGGNSRWFEVMRRLVEQPENSWWDVADTPAVEGRDQIFAQALEQAVAELRDLQGGNPARWNWGDLHTATFRNGSLGESGVAPIEALFNRGPFRTSGGASIVNATGWRTYASYSVRTVPSMRMIVDLGKLENSQTIHTTGQSGHAFHPNYIDMADLWRTIQYHPMLWTPEQAQSQAKHHLTLFPR